MEQEKLSFDKENVEESFIQTLESKDAWLVDAVSRDIETKASKVPSRSCSKSSVWNTEGLR